MFHTNYFHAQVHVLPIYLGENFLAFIFRFFSIKDLTIHLFSPWQRMQEGYAQGSSLEDMASAKFVNLMMRIVGFFVRILFIILGLLFLMLCLALGIVVFFAWILLPFIIIFSFVQAFIYFT